MRNAYRIFVRKPHRKRDDVGRSRHRLFPTGLGLGQESQTSGTTIYETSVSIKGREFPNRRTRQSLPLSLSTPENGNRDILCNVRCQFHTQRGDQS
jgi:hypothetical protein